MENIPGEELENMLFHILEKSKLEAKSNQLSKPLTDYVGRVSYYTGIPEHKLEEIQKKKLLTNLTDSTPLNFNMEILIWKHIIKLYSEKQLPTFELLFDHLKNETVLHFDIEQFIQKLNLLGIQYRTLSNTTFLMEDAHYFYEKYFYLNKMKNLRALHANIYYVEERLIDKSLMLQKPWKENEDTFDCTNGYVLFHAISKSGYKTGLFCNQATVEDFNKWISDILLGQLEKSSVIVFRKSPFHSTFKTTSVSAYDTKQEMLKCLQKHKIPYGQKMNRAELYDLIKKFVVDKQIYPIDQIIKANRLFVTRQPNNMFNLSPIDLMWEELRKSLTISLLDKQIFDIKDEIHAQLLSIPKEKFLEFDRLIEERENEMLNLHTDLEKAQNKLLSELEQDMSLNQ